MQTLSDETRTARMTHQCEFCYRTINPGEKYRITTHVADCIYDWKSCTHCEAMIRECDLWDYDTGEGIGPDTIGEWEPTDIFGLRCKVMWGHGWRRKTDESLYPIPVRAALEGEQR